MKLYITIDTEEDNWGDYRTEDISVDNVLSLPRLQKIFDRFQAIPTYLINYPVATNKNSLNVLKEIHGNGRCEIGAHCHPWNTPPFEEEINNYNSMLCNLPPALQLKKIQTLHEKIQQQFNINPVSFRAGRWGFSSSVAECIQSLGYKVDSSETPFWNWTKAKGPDFTNSPTYPRCYFSHDGSRHYSENCLIEVPPTIGFYQGSFKMCMRIRKFLLETKLSKLHLLGLLDRMRLLNFRWLSPELSTAKDMILLANIFIRKGYPYLNMSFHSNSLLPGKTPYVRDDKDLLDFLYRIETFLKFTKSKGIVPAPLSDAANFCPSKKMP